MDIGHAYTERSLMRVRRTMLSRLLGRFGFGRLAHNAILGTSWQMVRIGGQLIWVILIARTLGASGYGVFAGIAGLATTLGGLVGLGTGLLLLQNVSRDHSVFGEYWRKSMLTTSVSGLVLVVLITALAPPLFGTHIPVVSIILIGLSELVCYPLVYAAGFAFQAHERLGWSGALTALMSAARLAGVIAFCLFSYSWNVATYAWFHVVASVTATLCALLLTRIVLRPPRVRFSLGLRETGEGLSFASVWFTGNALTELDKTLALKLAGAEITGIYTAAYRLVSILTLPVASLTLAAQPRLFRLSGCPAEASRLVKHLVLVAAIYGVTASMALLLLARFLPELLGPSFEPAAAAAIQLVLVPPLFALRLVGNSVLMTSGRQLARMALELIGVAILFVLALLWIPAYGLTGIAMTVSVTEATLVIGVWGMIWCTKRRLIAPWNSR